MKKIQEVIVVEGYHDAQKIHSCLEAQCVITHGTHLSQKTLDYIKRVNETQGVIVFTDDDTPGRQIRSKIQAYLGVCKHAYLDKAKSRYKRKVGVEHASCDDILEALDQCATYIDHNHSITYQEFIQLELVTRSDLKKKLIQILSLPIMNTKRLFKTLNQLNYTQKDIASLLSQGENHDCDKI